MKNWRSELWLIVCMLLIFLPGITACGQSISSEEGTMNQLKLTIGSNVIMAELADTDAAKELAELLQNGPITMSASNYGGFEKVCRLGTGLTSGDTQVTAEAGDIMLYNSNQVVICYGSNSWEYTRLAKVVPEDMDSLKEILSGNESTVVIELANVSGTAPVITLNSGYEMPVWPWYVCA